MCWPRGLPQYAVKPPGLPWGNFTFNLPIAVNFHRFCLSCPLPSPKATGAGTRGGEREGMSKRVRLMMRLRRDKPGGLSYSIRGT